MHRIHDSKISPGMPAGSGYRDSEPPGAKRAAGDALEARPIERDKCGYSAPEGTGRKQVSDAAQVAFALLANCSDKADRRRRLDTSHGHSSGEAEKARDTAGVVAYARREKP